MFFLSEGNTEGTTVALTILTVGVNIFFFIMLAYLFLKSFKRKTHRFAKKVKKEAKNMLERSITKKKDSHSNSKCIAPNKEIEDAVKEINNEYNNKVNTDHDKSGEKPKDN
mmetsp:Transcript_23905/g.20876  ORF Transcript_23905/g.20876 Transcript_23905/m.20876 type:complete len:111 (-) Transcript_23905:433-765(-)